MNKERVISILSESGLLDHGIVNHEYAKFPCPWRRWNHKDSRGPGSNAYWINLDTLHGGCYVCGDHSDLWEILTFLGLFNDRPYLLQLAEEVLLKTNDKGSKIDDSFDAGAKKFEVGSSISPAEQIKLLKILFDGMGVSKPEIIGYLEKERKFEEVPEITGRFDLRYDKDEHRLVCPLYDLLDGRFSGMVGRAMNPMVSPKVRHYSGTKTSRTFGIRCPEAFWSAERFILVEGLFDAIRIDQMIKSADHIEIIWLNGCQLSEMQLKLLATRYIPVDVMLDNDAAGKKGGYHACSALKGIVPGIHIIGFPVEFKDPDEFGLKSDISQFEKVIEELLR